MNFAKKSYESFQCLFSLDFLFGRFLILENSAIQVLNNDWICPVWETDQIEASKKVFPVSSAHSLTQIIRPDFEF